MSILRRARRTFALSVMVAAVAACTESAEPSPPAGQQTQTVVLADGARGPAPTISGAKRGGTIKVLVNDDFEHLDPARAYSSRSQALNLILQRTLTAVRRRADGQSELVGDLATDTGRPSDQGRTWTFTLREGLRFEDGTPITAADVAYGIARSFSPSITDGPTWLQQWLEDSPDFARRYRGPYGGGAASPPGVTTPDKRTIIFRFARPRPDVPFVATLGNTTPVPRAKDTGSTYDDKPMSSGPYRVQSYHRTRQLVLVRNEHWDPATDPLRPAYPDRFIVAFGQTPAAATQQVLSGHRADATAISWEQVPPELMLGVARNHTAAQRATVGATAFVVYLKINTERVRELATRRALNCSIDRDGFIKVADGSAAAEPATTMLPRFVVGYRKYNAYDCGPTGDPDRAKRMISGRTIPLRYGFRDNDRGHREATLLRDNLAKAGFRLELVPIESSRYYSTVRTRDNGLDIYVTSWGADWATGATVIPALIDGRTIAARGNTNTSYLNDAAVNASIDRISAITDLDEAGRAWSALEEMVMRDHAPLVPIYYDRTCSVNGSGVGGLYLHDVLGVTSLLNSFVG